MLTHYAIRCRGGIGTMAGNRSYSRSLAEGEGLQEVDDDEHPGRTSEGEVARSPRSRWALDIKFCSRAPSEETDESVCASINEALDAIERGEYSDLPPLRDSPVAPTG